MASGELIQLIAEVAQEASVDLPSDWVDDFTEHLGEVRLISPHSIYDRLCRRVGLLMREQPELKDKYHSAYIEIRQQVRFRLAERLGFRELLETSGAKDRLKAFLADLPEGEAWSVETLKAKNGANSYMELYKLVGELDLAAIRFILGEDAETLLSRNPFEAEAPSYFNSDARLKGFLVAFLTSLPDGASWAARDILRFTWNGASGETWYSRTLGQGDADSKEGLTLERVKAILGDEASALLRQHPFSPKWILRDAKTARAILVRFLKSLEDDEAWSFSRLAEWADPVTGLKGSSLIAWIHKSFPTVDAAMIQALLGNRHRNSLMRNPFEPLVVVRIKNLRVARVYVIQFLESLPENQPWCWEDVRQWVASDGCKGSSVAHWLRSQARKKGKKPLEMLGLDPQLLTRNPFSGRTIPS